MDGEQFTQYILNNMERAHTASGRKVINCRCPECGDSIHKTSAHFYINVPDGETPLLYYCHKCNCGGIISYKKLIEWGIYTPEVAQFVYDYGILTSKNKKFRNYSNHITYNLVNTKTTLDDKTEFKRQYICNRLGINLSYQDLINLKIVLNLKDLLSENRITKITRYDNIVNDLDREFIGFLSIDNAFLNMRRTCEEGIVYKSIDKRYINYSIFDKKDTNQRFYTIPTMIDINTPNRIKLNIAEGPFDILSVYYNVRHCESGIYTCIAGNNYISVIMYFLTEIKLPNTEIHLYTDNDRYGTVDKAKYIMSSIPDPTIPFYLHHNSFEGEKDFGVPVNRIKESILKLR